MSTVRRGSRAALDQSGAIRRSAYERFHMHLMGGTIRPGQLLAQRELVTLLGISLGALRELLPKLEAEGLIVVQPQRGIMVPSVDLKMIRNAYQLRLALEREAVMAAAAEVENEEQLENQIQLHESILERFKTDHSAVLFEEAQSIDAQMHAFLIEQTRNEILIQVYNINTIRVRLINVERQRLTPSVLPDAFRDHLDILNAILERDLPRAVQAMERHIEKARARAVSF